jgi:hypothetical protein
LASRESDIEQGTGHPISQEALALSANYWQDNKSAAASRAQELKPVPFAAASNWGTSAHATKSHQDGHGKGVIMNHLARIAFVLLLATAPVDATDLGADMTAATVYAGPVLSMWNAASKDIGYAFAGHVERFTDQGAKPWSVLTVGAQINAVNHSGVNQIVFGIATEAWAGFGSFSMVTGIEATAINREPDNPWRKISMWSTFKNRPDTEYFTPPSDPANMNAQALRIESQPGTGFERGIVFAGISLHVSRNVARPVAIDFAEMDEAAVESIDVMRFPDGCSLVYVGQGILRTRCDK